MIKKVTKRAPKGLRALRPGRNLDLSRSFAGLSGLRPTGQAALALFGAALASTSLGTQLVDSFSGLDPSFKGLPRLRRQAF